MKISLLEDAEWYHALTLNERLKLLRSTHLGPDDSHVDSTLAKHRLQVWRKQSPFTDESLFQQRLQMDKLSEEEFLYLLGEPIRDIRDQSSDLPTWLVDLDWAFADSRDQNSKLIMGLKDLPWDEQSKQMLGFLNLIGPLLTRSCNQLREALQALDVEPLGIISDTEALEKMLVANLAAQLLPMLSRTLVLELNVARLRGLLCGETSTERFQNFIQLLCQRDYALAILKEHPVLARQLKICIDNWVAFSLEFLGHLYSDWEAIQSTFSRGQNPGPLVGLRTSLGDRHRRGRSVTIAEFDSGLLLVYKPRSLAAEVNFQELLIWLNERSGYQFFQTISVLDRNTHGWVEFVKAKSCKSIEEIQDFYKRQGAYLALLHIMEATDFHFENLIAAGEYPILIDLETLWHQSTQDLLPLDTSLSEHVAAYDLAESVLRVGLLPLQLWSSTDFKGVDLSGLGANRNQLFTPTKVIQFENIGSDAMRVVRERAQFPGRDNRPSLNGDDVNTLEYIQSIMNGFIEMYRILIRARDELIAEHGWLARFAQTEVRSIIRPSQTYGLLLSESFHPDLLRDALDRERHFDRLWVGVENYPYYEKVIPAEREDLRQGDIPIFHTRPGSCDLWSSTGQRFAGFYKESSLAHARRRLQTISEKDIDRQTWFIRASFASMDMEMTDENSGTEKRPYPNVNQLESSHPTSCERFQEAARAIADRLTASAFLGKEDACWLGLAPLGNSLRPMPMGADFYFGITGICLFLAYLGAIESDQRYTALAQAALKTARHQMSERFTSFTPIGAFSGWGGMIYSLVHLGVLWGEKTVLDEAIHILDILPQLIPQDKENDLMTGAAGCIASLLCLYRVAPSDHLLDIIVDCGNQLMSCAQKTEHGVGWTSSIPASAPLTGFSHGAAGIAWALLEASELTGEQRFRSIALDAIDYERSTFSPTERNWPDLRIIPGIERHRKRFRADWCHGAPGIGLARLLSLKHIDSEETRSEIDIAIQTTLSSGFGRGHCLCHGDLGNIDILLTAGRILSNAQWQLWANQLAGQVLESIEKQGWICGVPLGTETPGMMTGLAGIGYEFLRLSNPDRIPSVLAVSPPNLVAWNGGQT